MSNTKTVQDLIKERTLLNRAKRLARHLGISMSLMADADVDTRVFSGGSNPAYTEKQSRKFFGGRHSWFESKYVFSNRYLTSFDADYLGNRLDLWLGAAWHELGHVLWSPFGGSIPITVGLNLLEDARIETLLLKRFPKMRGALMATLHHMMRETSTDPVFSYAWAAGRTHLPRDVRSKLRVLCPGKIADQIDRIFRDYLSMGSKLDVAKATVLATELNQLINPEGSGAVCATTLNSTGDGIVGEDGSGDTQIDGEILDEIGGDGDREPGTSNAPSQVRKTNQEVREDIAKEVQQDITLKEEVSKLENYLAGAGAGGNYGNSGNTSVRTPTPDSVELARRVRHVAARFNDESGKGLVRRRDSGRLRPMRYERTGDIDSAYDQWEPGLDQEMFIGLVIDISGSMRNAPIAEVTYALDMGLRDVAETSIVYFNDGYYTPDEQNSIHRQVKPRTHGSTEPREALAYMHGVMMQAPQMNKLLVVYTDGIWDEYDSYIEGGLYLQDLRNQGVNIRILGESSNFDVRTLRKNMPWLQNHEFIATNTLADLPDVVLGWTKTVLTKGEL